MEFQFPAAFFAVPAVWLAALLLGWRPRRDLGPFRRTLALTFRLLTLLAFIAAISEPSLKSRVEAAPYTAYLIDISESVDDASLEAAMADVEAHSSKTPGSHALLLFAGGVETEGSPSREPVRFDDSLKAKVLHRRTAAKLVRELKQSGGDSKALSDITAFRERLDVDHTRLQEAMLAAQAQAGSNPTPTFVVITDGYRLDLPTNVDPARMAIVPTRGPSQEVVLTSLSAPSAVRLGEPFDLKLRVRSLAAGTGKLFFTIDDVEIPELTQDFSYGAGETLTRIQVARNRFERGSHVIRATLAAAADTETRNNRAAAVTQVIGKPKVLLLKEAGQDSRALRTALKLQDIEVDEALHSSLPGFVTQLGNYDSVIFLGVPQDKAVEAGRKELEAYVSDRGGGLLLVCDTTVTPHPSAENPLANLLPIRFTPPNPSNPDNQPGPKKAPTPKPVEVKAAQVVLLLLIDKSGSMHGKNLEYAKAACIAAAKTLSPHDFVGVIGFDALPHWVVEITNADRIDLIEDKVLRLRADGGTDIYAALLGAQHALSRVRTAVKHVVVLSDGETPLADFETLVGSMAKDGITVSTVTLYERWSKPEIMRAIAELGHGRHMSSDANHLPQVFTNEVRQVTGQLKREEHDVTTPPVGPIEQPTEAPKSSKVKSFDFFPKLKEQHQVLEGIDLKSAPMLHGMLPSEAKPSALVPIVSSIQDKPLLAIWRYGLGKVAAWTSDFGGPWTGDLTQWQPSVKLMAQLVRSLATAESRALSNRVSLELIDDVACLRIAPDRNERPEAVLVEPTTRALPLRLEEDGMLTARFTVDRPSSEYRVRVRSGDDLAFAGTLMTHEPEISGLGPDANFMLRARQMGFQVSDQPSIQNLAPSAAGPIEGRIPLAPWLLIAGLVLLLMDVGVRRFK